MKKRLAFTVAEIGIGLIVVIFLILVTVPIISHNQQQKQQTQTDYLTSLNSGAEKSDVAKIKQQAVQNETKLNEFSQRLAGLEEYVRQYVSKAGTSSNNVISNSKIRIQDGSYVCNVTGYEDDKGATVTPSEAEMPQITKGVASGTTKVIFKCYVYRQ